MKSQVQPIKFIQTNIQEYSVVWLYVYKMVGSSSRGVQTTLGEITKPVPIQVPGTLNGNRRRKWQQLEKVAL
jgi:hypothetical protein